MNVRVWGRRVGRDSRARSLAAAVFGMALTACEITPPPPAAPPTPQVILAPTLLANTPTPLPPPTPTIAPSPTPDVSVLRIQADKARTDGDIARAAEQYQQAAALAPVSDAAAFDTRYKLARLRETGVELPD